MKNILSWSEIQRAEILLGRQTYGQSDDTEGEDTTPKIFVYAGLSANSYRAIVYLLLFCMSICLLLSIFHSCYFLFFFIGFPFLLVIFLRRSAFKRSERFERDYPALLLSLASSIRTGLDPLAALINCEGLFPAESEVRCEIANFRKHIESGMAENDAVMLLGATLSHPDIKLFRTAFILSRREGSSLGECLRRLTKVTRHRQSFRRKVRSGLAMQKFSSLGIAACAVLISVMQFLMNPDGVKAALAHPVGVKVLFLGFTMMFCGIVWMTSMGRSRL